MPFGAPTPPVSTGDERELLLGFLRWQREQVVATTVGLDDDQLRWTPDGRLLPLLGIVHHLTGMEQRWIEHRFLATPFPPRVEELPPPPGLTGAGVLAAYEARAARTDEIVRAAPGIDAPCLGVEGDEGQPLHVMFGFEQPVDLRYALVHAIEETAHHAGHADATRELLDGSKMRA